MGGLLRFYNHADGLHYYATYDGNGNVAALLRRDTGVLSATYEYGPFGEVLRASGAMAKANPFRFSTKYQDDETDLFYYGYRFYNAATGRWPSRDPIEEIAFRRTVLPLANSAPVDRLLRAPIHPTYLFSKNDAQSYFDVLGLDAQVTWNPPLGKGPKGDVVVFLQVGYGGWGAYCSPFVDDGSAGFGATGTGCPEYPNFGREGNFEDSPGGITGPVTFITCMACATPCNECTSQGPRYFTRKLSSVLRCKKWTKGTLGSMSSGWEPAKSPFQDADEEDTVLLWATVIKKYPTAPQKCYSCDHKPKK